MENQAAEVEAKHHVEMEKRRQALADGGHAALADAERKVEEYEKETKELKMKLSGAEEVRTATA